MEQTQAPVIQVKDLSISFHTSAGELNAIRGVNFQLRRGETVAIVGESGSGKSVTVKAMMGIRSSNETINSGEILYTHSTPEGASVTEDLLLFSKRRMIDEICGQRIAMVFQDPMTALNPVMTIEKQLCEGMTHHLKLSRQAAREKGLELLREVGIPDPALCMRAMRISSPAACASGWSSPWRWPATPTFSSATNRPPLWMSRFRPRF